MNALVRKEMRLLRQSFLIGVIAALSMWALPLGTKSPGFWTMLRGVLPFVVCPLMVVMLALDTFGGEISAKTFSQLLTQSVSRRRLWWTKVSLAAGAILSLWAIWFWSLMALGKLFGTNYFPTDEHGIAIQSLLYLLAMFSGGLWTVLLFRQVGVAFWVTILVPVALCVGTYSQLSNWEPHQADKLVAILFVAYGILGFLFAQWLFLRAQDVQWAGGVIAIPKWRPKPKVREDVPSARRYRPRVAVLKREFQLHQSQFIIAGVLLALHIAAIVLRNFGGMLRGHEALQALVHIFWGLWLLMPVLIGCAAIAEERKLGTLEGQLCIPATHRFQFLTKVGVVVFLSILFGVLMPTVLESLDGSRIMGNAHAMTNEWLPDFNNIIFWYWILLTPIAVVSGLVAFYFSSLCGNTLKALGPSFLGILLVGFALAGSIAPEEVVVYPLWRGFIGDLIGIPVIGFVGLWLAYSNYRNLQRGLGVWNRNLGGFALALVFSVGTATGLYHRAWERLLPVPQHGPARLGGSPRPELKRQQGSIVIKLRGGQLWQGNFGYSLTSLIQLAASDWTLKELSGGSGFDEGTNWAQVADCLFDAIGIQKDGSLWVARKRLPVEFNRVYFAKAAEQPKEPASGPPRFEKIGDARDWKNVVASGRYAMLLKQDGTLWTWSTNGMSFTNWPGLAALQLKQVGSDSDWAELRKVSSRQIYLRKKDGRVWSNINIVADTGGSISWADQTLVRSPFLDGHDWLGLAMVEYPATNTRMWRDAAGMGLFNRSIVGVRDDGRFRLVGGIPDGRGDVINRDVQLNPAADWIGLETFQTGEAVLLKSDGSLWRWNLVPEENGGNPNLNRIGTQSDWRAIASDETDFLTFSADGSIWAWRKDPEWQNVTGGFYVPPLIEVSRRPQFVANIFGSKQ